MAMLNSVNVKQCKKCNLYLRKEGFHNFFDDMQTK